MQYQKIHPWKVGIKEAIQIQEFLKRRIVLENKTLRLRRIAGVDVGFFNHKAKAVVCIFNFPELKLIELKTAFKRVDFPYIAGLLSFREGPLMLEAFKKIKNIPDLILFDGQGICHPRRLGIATHLGIILKVATVGCAKSLLYGIFKEPSMRKGSFSYIYDGNTKEILGVALRTRSNVKPLFVSPGYKINLERAKDLVLKLCLRFRVPEPLRVAHHFTKDAAV